MIDTSYFDGMFARERLPDVNAMTKPEREKFLWREFIEDSFLTA